MNGHAEFSNFLSVGELGHEFHALSLQIGGSGKRDDVGASHGAVNRVAVQVSSKCHSGMQLGVRLPDHPLRPGQLVTVFHLPQQSPPTIEGRARIIAPIPNIANVYEVRFVGERDLLRRLVHPGAWQSDPLGMLAALIDHWRVAIAPELIASETLFNRNPKPATSRRKTR